MLDQPTLYGFFLRSPSRRGVEPEPRVPVIQPARRFLRRCCRIDTLPLYPESPSAPVQALISSLQTASNVLRLLLLGWPQVSHPSNTANLQANRSWPSREPSGEHLDDGIRWRWRDNSRFSGSQVRRIGTCRRVDCRASSTRYSNPRGSIEHAMLRVREGPLTALLF